MFVVLKSVAKVPGIGDWARFQCVVVPKVRHVGCSQNTPTRHFRTYGKKIAAAELQSYDRVLLIGVILEVGRSFADMLRVLVVLMSQRHGCRTAAYIFRKLPLG